MSKKKLSKLLALYLPYVVIGLLATNLGEAWRLAVGKELGDKIVSLMGTIPAAFANPLPSLHPFDLFIGLCCGAGMRLAVYLKGKNAKKYRHGMEYGSARWGGPKDIEPFMAPKFEDNIILTKTERLMMSNRPPDPKNARNKNVLVVGGSGSGKTRFFIKPNLLQCDSKNFPVSFVVTDPKGSIGVECGEALLKHGYKLKFFNTINFSKSMRYNPMAYIHSEKDVLKLVTALMTNTKGEGQGGDPFWDKAERLLLVSLIAYLHYEAPVEEQNFATLLEMLNTMQVLEDDEEYQNPVDLLFEELAKKKPNSFAGRQYKLYKLAAGKTAKSILISCGARLAPFDIPQLREVMAYDELELDRIGDRKTAVFFIISDTTQTYNFLVALAFSQMFNLLCERADNVHGGRLPHHVRVLWDEAANTGQVPQLEKIVAVIRSREISLTLFYQQLAQCKAIYDKHAETILGNMDSVIFLGGREASTIKEISENWLGKATISMQTDSRSRGQSESYSQNNQRLGRELMTPSELATMPGDKCILQLRGLPPFYSPKYDLKKHPNYRYTAEADKKKNAFDLDRLINRRRRPGPDELCEVYAVAVPDDGLTSEDEDILNYDDIDDPDAFA
ncbi:MAG: VirD4-like conjugal transfer protein, CD1115 family [Faecalibacterium prausnitzii]